MDARPTAAPIELHAFMGLADLFRERGWGNPHFLPLTAEAMPGPALLDMLEIPAARVEVLFVNRKAVAVAHATIRPGDRVALVPPGVPGPHRFLLGFKNA
ncbi:MAG: MoaD/ThiS family protein [Rhodocyclales bacterium]|nr:MoaD/ThiS family protein [Rhodocyclales bacterium]